MVQGDTRPPPACPRLLGTAARAGSALRGRPGARARGSRHRRPAGSWRGTGTELRANPRGAGAPAAAVRRLRARPRRRGRLCRAYRPRRPGPARRPALPGAARQPLRPPPEPAACGARGRPPGASFARSQQLRVDWPAASERAATEALRSRALAELTPARNAEALPPGALGRVYLKELVDERGRTTGYDPNLDSCLVTEDLLAVLAELQQAVQDWAEDSSLGLATAPDAGADSCMVVHVVSCEEEFQQQKLDLVWWKLDDQAPLRQKHLVCGPVKVAGAPGTLTAPEYYELRHAQVCKASALKRGRDLAQDSAWMEIFRVLCVATIKFEMLSTAPQSQLLLALADSSISTKGTKSGTFVMYNCARLATLFEGYKCSMEQGLYPTFPPVSSLDFSLLHDEHPSPPQGEWLLLFNSILPFPDLLSQTAALPCTAPGLHITARTEMVCKFLVQLSMDFSSYYNRVHILGEPRPHLFGQMFARLQLLRAVREVLHTGLAMLGLPPLSHI
ncbi:DALR anticodon-binding domain-containing protein 3 isoform X4 [Neophocaena asiaeorientalis asiaeorientalis]|uniref:DALR anticodon-binding domain-containing protein 3 isoform X4 n=1 Tax=Neophocaena asiaeorientalis asiaeorientalis TaxID=1706337 RepID=A0A341AS47_NEOAA|nr:DALR anticodon-binding domain-containing protein 3 isoform X4 [Neophocaena asiaeorientalis asiaeorientalis]